MRRKITCLSKAHYQELRQYCVNNNLPVDQEWSERRMFAAEVPDEMVESLREMGAAVNDDESGFSVGEIAGLKKI